MRLNNSDWKVMLKLSSTLLKKNADLLSKMDSETGDGDHGVTINNIAAVIDEAVEKWPEGMSLKDFLDDLGWNIMGVNGGSAGPLWGSVFQGLANGVNEENEIDKQLFKNMFIAALDNVYEISNAKIGDKTMMDALIPAVAAIKKSNAEIPDMALEAFLAAKNGAENTANYIAKFGRAKNLKEKTLGHKDPGAVSLSILFEGMSNALKVRSNI